MKKLESTHPNIMEKVSIFAEKLAKIALIAIPQNIVINYLKIIY